MNIYSKIIYSLFLLLVIQTSIIIGDEEETPAVIVEEENVLDKVEELDFDIGQQNDTIEQNNTLNQNDTLQQNDTTAEVADPQNEFLDFTDPVNCLTNKTYGPVEIVNYTRLMELLIFDLGTPNRTRSSREEKAIPGPCILVMFYAKWCVFSSQAAPHFNAIPRFYPYIKVVAIDAMKFQNFNTQYGIVGVPTLMFVHNAKPVAKFNKTVYTLEVFSKFISYLTRLQPNESLYVTSADFSGPVPSVPSNETDYCLVLSWVFIAACLLYFTTKSQWYRQFIELVQNTWRESNAQHEHVD